MHYNKTPQNERLEYRHVIFGDLARHGCHSKEAAVGSFGVSARPKPKTAGSAALDRCKREHLDREVTGKQKKGQADTLTPRS